MSCRKHSPGDPCCPEGDDCCSGATVPPGWEQISTCCFRKYTTVPDDRVDFCSDVYMRCRKQATLAVDYYTYKPTIVECDAVDEAGFDACVEAASSLGCSGDDEYCGTSKYTLDRTVELRMIGYFDTPAIVTYATRVDCGGGMCKWLLQSTYARLVKYDVVVSGKELYEIEAVVENCCEFTPQLSDEDATGCFDPGGFYVNSQLFQACGSVLLDELPESGDLVTFTNSGAELCPYGAEDWQRCLPQCDFGSCPWTLNNHDSELSEAAIRGFCIECDPAPSCTQNDLLITCTNYVHWVNPATTQEYCVPVVSMSGTFTYTTLTINNLVCLEIPDGWLLSPTSVGSCYTCTGVDGPYPIATPRARECSELTYSHVIEELDGSVDVPCPDEWSITF